MALRSIKCRLCFRAINVNSEHGDRLSQEDFYITKKSFKEVSLIKCDNCGLVQADNFISSNELYDSYKKVEDPDFEKEFTSRKAAFLKDVKKCASMMDQKKSDILEIGGFTGIGAEAIKTVFPSSSYLGVEPSLWACSVAKNRGYSMMHGKVGDSLKKSFDLIFSWDVIEHLEYPHDLFKWCSEIATPNAHLFVNTVNWASIYRKVFANRWWFIEPMHRTYFTPEILERLAKEHQWEVVNVWSHTKMLSVPYLIQRAFLDLFGVNAPIPKRLLGSVTVPLKLGQMSILFKKTKNVSRK